jgi:hypothetical protein
MMFFSFNRASASAAIVAPHAAMAASSPPTTLITKAFISISSVLTQA